jgi:hypothetical protein
MQIVKDNSQTGGKSIKSVPRSRASDSFYNLTDNQPDASNDSMTKHLALNFQITDNIEDNLKNYYTHNNLEDIVFNNKNNNDAILIKHREDDIRDSHETHEIDLEKFYEQKQSFVEDAIMRKSVTSASSSNFNMKRTFTFTQGQRNSKNNNQFSNTEKNVRGSSKNTRSSLTDQKQLDLKNITRNNPPVQTPKKSVEKVLSYEQFKTDNNSNKPSSTSKAMIRSNSEKTMLTRKPNTPSHKTKESTHPVANFKLKITNDSVEEIPLENDQINSRVSNKSSKNKISFGTDNARDSKKSPGKSTQLNTPKGNTFRKNNTQKSNNISLDKESTSSFNISRKPTIVSTKNSDQTSIVNIIKEGESKLNRKIISLKKKNEELDDKVKPLIAKCKTVSDPTNYYNTLLTLSEKVDKEEDVVIIPPEIEEEDNLGKLDKQRKIEIDANFKIENELLLHNNIPRSSNPLLGKQLSLRSSKFTSEFDKRLDTFASCSEKDDPVPVRKQTIQSDIITKGSNMNENYAEDIKQIYHKRKIGKYPGEVPTETAHNTNNEDEKLKQKFFDDFYHRNIKWKKGLMTKTVTRKEAIESNIQKNCSFTPKLTNSSRRILSKSVNYAPKNNEDFYTKNMKWKQHVEKHKQNQHLINERKEYEECYFYPVTNKSLNDMTKNIEKHSDDYVYVKNMNWLNMVKENRKRMDLERLEELRKSAKIEKIYDRLAKSKSMKNITNDGNEIIQTNSRELSAEEDLKKNLVISTGGSPNYLSTIRSGFSSAKHGSHIQFTPSIGDVYNQSVVEKEILEIKSLISSLKQALEENKKLSSNLNTCENESNFKLQKNELTLEQSCNVNMCSPARNYSKKSMTRSQSVDHVKYLSN